MRSVSILLAAVLLTGCSNEVREREEKGSLIVGSAAEIVSLKLVKIPDGPDCVVAVGSAKSALSCDWKPLPPAPEDETR